MARAKLNPKIWARLLGKLEGKMQEQSIRNAITSIRTKHPFLTLNAAAEIFAKKRGFSVSRYLNDGDRSTLKTIEIKEVKILPASAVKKRKIIKIAQYNKADKLLGLHLIEINKAYTFGCYTAAFILCRKVLENMLIHRILKRKYPSKKKKNKEKYYDIHKGRFLDFSVIIKNLRRSSKDFGTEKKLVNRICDLAGIFRENANDMNHSLYHIATKREIDSGNFQHILDLIEKLEGSLN